MPLQEILLQMNIKVDKAYDGEEAMQKINLNQSKSLTCPSHKPYQLVILDNDMPIKSGVVVAQEIKAGQLNGVFSKDMKICMLTGDP
jgi:DNA-binding response OmpR family regulator